MATITGFRCFLAGGRPVPCEANGNNAAFSCVFCGGPVLAVLGPVNARGDSAARPSVCVSCGFQYWVEIDEPNRLLTLHVILTGALAAQSGAMQEANLKVAEFLRKKYRQLFPQFLDPFGHLQKDPPVTHCAASRDLPCIAVNLLAKEFDKFSIEGWVGLFAHEYEHVINKPKTKTPSPDEERLADKQSGWVLGWLGLTTKETEEFLKTLYGNPSGRGERYPSKEDALRAVAEGFKDGEKERIAAAAAGAQAVTK